MGISRGQGLFKMLKIDLHIHTIHSGHACPTFYEVLEYAAKKKMNMVAVTDHGPSLRGSAIDLFFRIGYRAPKEYKGVKVLWGCEANIVDKDGNLDVKGRIRKSLDIVLLGIHGDDCFKDLGKEGNTKAIIKCFENEKPHIFTHPEAMMMDYDFEKVCQAACDNNVLLELNISSLFKVVARSQPERLPKLKKMVEIARKNKKKIIVNTDAHFLHEVGDDALLKKYKKELNITDDIIINNYPDELMKILERK